MSLSDAVGRVRAYHDQRVDNELNNYGRMRNWYNLTGFARDRMNSAENDRYGTRNQFMRSITGLQAFDPGAYANEAAGSMFNTISRDFNAAEGQRRAAMNRRGLLNSTVGNTAASNRFNDALANAMSGLAMQTAGMRQGQLGQVAGLNQNLYGMDTDRSNMFTDMMYGAAASGINQREAARQAAAERRNRLWGAGIGAIGRIAGAVIPGL